MTRPSRKILYVLYAAPGVYPPIERSARIFKNGGWQVGFVGVRAEGESGKLTSSLHAETNIEYIVHRPGGVSALRSYLRFWTRAVRRVWQDRPDVVYVSDPAPAYMAGLLISWLTPALTVMHEHDTLHDHDKTLLLRLLRAARRRLARRADILVNPQDTRAAWMRALSGGRDVQVVYNCPATVELPPARAFDAKPSGLRLWHHGSLGPGQLPVAVIDALAKLPDDVTFEFAGYETVSTKGHVDRMLERARALGVEHRVTFHGAFPTRQELYAQAAQAHLGVALFARVFREPMVGASNKPFDFLSCSLPLLVNDTEEWRDFFVARDMAVSCNPEDGTDIARAVRALYDDRAALARMATRGRALIETEWHYEARFQPVLDQIETLLTEQQPKQ